MGEKTYKSRFVKHGGRVRGGLYPTTVNLLSFFI